MSCCAVDLARKGRVFTNTTTIVKHDVREVAADTLAEMVRVRIATRRS